SLQLTVHLECHWLLKGWMEMLRQPDGSSHKQSLQEGKENYASRMHLWEIDMCGAGRNALILKFFVT
ncbi:mCG1041499, partial [Mus musculus]